MRNAPGLSLRLIVLGLPVFVLAAQAKDAMNAPAKTFSQVGDWRPIVTGRLENGVRFAILPRQGREPGVGLLMRNEGGFIAERRPGERGLAHLIEHLFLVSPTNNAPDDVRRFIRIGLPLTFPAPSVGTTSWRETNYFVSTRTAHAADLDTLLALFREVASDLTFRADAVDEQRADVMREMAGRKLGNHIYASYVAAVAPGSPTDVIDAQNSDDVPTATLATIRALYHRLYQPENMMIVIVGNVDAAQTKALIQKRFGGWKRAGSASARAPLPTFRSERIAPVSFSALQQGRRIAMMTATTPTPPPPSTRSQQAKAMLIDMLAVRAVSNRLASAQPGSAPGKVGMFIENGEQGHRQIMLWDNFAADQWRPAIAGLRKTTCDLAMRGFSDLEWAQAKQNLILDLDQRTQAMAAVANVELAKDLSHALAAGQDLIAPDELLREAQNFLPMIGTKAGNQWWRRQWRAGVEHIRAEAPELMQIKNPASAVRSIADEAVEDASCKVRR